MKFRKFLCFVFFCVFGTGIVLAGSDDENQSMTSEQYLFQVQEDIEDIVVRSLHNEVTNGVDDLKIIIKKLKGIDVSSSSNISYHRDYWLAYGYYRLAIELMRLDTVENIDKSIKYAPIDSAIQILKKMPQDTEVMSLYAIVAGMSYEYLPFTKMFSLTKEINRILQLAIETGPDNIRALYANAISDYYTPAQYGGGKKVYNYLQKAINIKKVQHSSPLEPSWGHQEAFDLLIQYYVKKKDMASARKTFKDLLSIYPNSKYKNHWPPLLKE